MTLEELENISRQLNFKYVEYKNGEVSFILPKFLDKSSPTIFLATVKNNNFLKYEYQKELEIIYKHLIEIG